jgi:hypothetical protein
MKFEETNAYRARAAHCAHQAGLTQDTILKKFWDDLSDDWLALNSTMLAVDNARIKPSFVRLKDANCV